MPEEIFIIALTAIVFGTLTFASVVKSIFRYLGTKSQAQQTGAGLTASELRTLIQEAVVEATEPLAERVGDLEEHLAVSEPRRSGRRDLLEGSDGYRTETSEAKQRQPVR